MRRIDYEEALDVCGVVFAIAMIVAIIAALIWYAPAVLLGIVIVVTVLLGTPYLFMLIWNGVAGIKNARRN